MKTERLIDLLASSVVAVNPHAIRRRYVGALGLGALVSALLMLTLLGVRPDIAGAVRMPMFWLKLAFPAMLVVGAMLATVRLSRPGAKLGGAPAAIALPVVAVWMMSAAVLLGAAADERYALVFGETWAYCPLMIAALAVPLFVAALWAMKGLAPTRLALAGAAAGLLAGAGGALVYALHCPEMAPPFLAVWYVLGMVAPAGAGAIVGPLLLRW